MFYPNKNIPKQQHLNGIKSLPSQRGAAIIVALFVVALVAAAAIVMIDRLRIDMRRTQLIQNANTAYLTAQGSVIWAIDTLNTNWQRQQPNKIVDRTPIKSSLDHQDGATITGVIKDAQGYFNINNLIDAKYQPNFTQLLKAVAPQLNLAQAQQITLAVSDWIAPNFRNPELDEYYIKLNPAYRSPHRPMVSISELRLVRGITPNLFAKLAPYVIALPKATQINVNNADVPVVMSLSPSMTIESAKAIVAATQKTPFQTTQDFLNFPVVKNNPIDVGKITVVSNYFLLETNVTLDQQKLTLFTLFERSTQGKQVNTSILWQSKGTL